MSTQNVSIHALGDTVRSDLISWRRFFHEHPNESLHEADTAGAIRAILDELGFSTRMVADGTGVIGDLRGGLPGGCVAIRADIDALPVDEKTGLSFASVNPGVMHACGHDAHIAMALAACKMLSRIQGDLRGTVRAVFQPAEEVAQGAIRLVREGVLDGVEAIFGFHVLTDISSGKISIEPGARMASADFYDIEIRGTSCHGGRPGDGVDAIVCAAALVMNLQTIVSRERNADHPAIITIGEIAGGEKRNVVAGHVKLGGTLRAFDEETRQMLIRRVEEMTRDTCALYRAEGNVIWHPGSGAVINEERMTALAAKSAATVMGPEALCIYPRSMLGDDMSEYLSRIPGCYGFLGVGNPDDPATLHPQHSCFYTVDEEALLNGAMVEAQFVLDALARTE